MLFDTCLYCFHSPLFFNSFSVIVLFVTCLFYFRSPYIQLQMYRISIFKKTFNLFLIFKEWQRIRRFIKFLFNAFYTIIDFLFNLISINCYILSLLSIYLFLLFLEFLLLVDFFWFLSNNFFLMFLLLASISMLFKTVYYSVVYFLKIIIFRISNFIKVFLVFFIILH